MSNQVTLTISVTPPILIIWPYKRFLPFEITYLLIPSPRYKHEPRIVKGQNLLITNHLDLSIHMTNQEQVFRLYCNFWQPQHIEQKCWTTVILLSSLGKLLLIFIYAMCRWRCSKHLKFW
jgi:hypothetical protein